VAVDFGDCLQRDANDSGWLVFACAWHAGCVCSFAGLCKALALPAIRAFAREILVVVKVVLMKVSPVGLEQITIFVVTHQ
jgi:hypothetical protein